MLPGARHYFPSADLTPLRLSADGLEAYDGAHVVVIVSTDGDDGVDIVRAWDRIPIVAGSVDRTYPAVVPGSTYRVRAYVDPDGTQTCTGGVPSEITDVAARTDTEGEAHIIFQAEAERLCVVPAQLPYSGDGDFSGCVDDTDSVVLRSEFGLSGDRLEADYRRDGDVDGDDLAILRVNYCSCDAMSPWF
jgi:hypothetical protein